MMKQQQQLCRVDFKIEFTNQRVDEVPAIVHLFDIDRSIHRRNTNARTFYGSKQQTTKNVPNAGKVHWDQPRL
jgi:hypothetical protein